MNLPSLPLPLTVGRSANRRKDRVSRDPEGSLPIQAGSCLDRILCAVDVTSVGHRAMRQAIAICRRGGAVDFIAVLPTGASAAQERRLRMALDGAARTAKVAERRASTELVWADRASDALLRAASARDILVMPATDRPDEPGLGRVATEVAHRCPGSLLLARRSTRSDRFPSHVLLASDGSPGSWYAARACADLAVAHGGRFDLVRVSGERESISPSQVRAQSRLLELVGAPPESFLERPGDVPGRICQTAINGHASLLVVGRGSKPDPSRLGSVAESVAHRAGCSVLLASGNQVAEAPLPPQ